MKERYFSMNRVEVSMETKKNDHALLKEHGHLSGLLYCYIVILLYCYIADYQCEVSKQ